MPDRELCSANSYVSRCTCVEANRGRLCRPDEGEVMSEADGSRAPRRIALIGAPIDMGASQRGTLMGPAALRTAGLVTVLDSLGFEVTDHGDVSIADMADLADPSPERAN